MENKTKFLFETLKAKEQLLENLEDDKKLHRQNCLKKAVQTLSSEDRDRYRFEYESLMKESSCGRAHTYRTYGWEGALTQFDFDLFLQEKVKASLPENWDIKPELEKKKRQFIKEKSRIHDLYALGIQTIKDIKNGVITSLNVTNDMVLPEMKTLS